MLRLETLAERENTTMGNLKQVIHYRRKNNKPLEWRNWRFIESGGRVAFAVPKDGPEIIIK